MYSKLGIAAAGAALLALTACSGSGSGDGAADSPTTASPQLRATSTVDTVDCGAPRRGDGTYTVDGTSALIICRGDKDALRFESTDPAFPPLAKALSTPEPPFVPGIACPAIAYPSPKILAVAPDGIYLVNVPSGQCGQMLPNVAAAVQAASRTKPATPGP
jgi:hypothetical protein